MKKHHVKKMIKTITAALLALAFAASLTCCGSQPETQTSDAGASESPAEEAGSAAGPLGGALGSQAGTDQSAADISEAAMENFLDKAEAGNYIINCEGHKKATVYSEDLVFFNLDVRFDGISYDGFALMTVNEDETFLGLLDEDAMADLTFVQEGTALDFACYGTVLGDMHLSLPNSWIRRSAYSIWDLFYNDVEDPLTFVSHADEVKALVQLFADIGEAGMPRMQDVYLELDSEDPTEAHLRTSFTDGYPTLDDVDIVITFGNAEADPRAEAWINDPDREYPPARDGWGDEVMDLNAVFLPGYGETAVPFPDFATYAFTLDAGAVLTNDEIRIRDSRATEEGMQEYIGKLLDHGFSAVTDDNGETCYRLLLRDERKCSSSIYLDYAGGVTMTARKYYEFPAYNGLDEINAQITEKDFPQLPADECFTDYSAIDTAYEAVESWLCFFNYDLVLFTNFRYEDRDAAEAYVNAYVESLEGFAPAPEGEDQDEYDETEAYLGAESEELKRFTALKDEDVYYYCAGPEGKRSFKYLFSEDGETVSMLFKSESYVTTEETRELLAGAGFPEISLDHYSSCRDTVEFQKYMYGRELPLDLALSLSFETAADADAFLDPYICFIREEGSFDITDPETADMDKNIVYTKESGSDLLIIGCNYDEGQTLINLEFRVRPE